MALTKDTTDPDRDAERRDSGRAHVTAAICIDSSDRSDRVGITRNVSRRGALFHSASRYEVGEKIVVTLRRPGSESEERISATVARAELLDPDVTTVFRYLTAVEFDEPVNFALDSDTNTAK